MKQENYTPVKLRNDIIKEIDKIKEGNTFLRTRPQVIGYVVDHYLKCKKYNGGNVK